MRNPKLWPVSFAAFGSMLLAGCLGGVAGEDREAAQFVEKAKGQEKLSRILEGYEAGQPINCLSVRAKDRQRVISGTALVYRRGNKIFVNYTRDPDQLDDRDAISAPRITSEICKGDILNKFTTINGASTGFAVLAEFIPYTKR